jgi:hypothetical protein
MRVWIAVALLTLVAAPVTHAAPPADNASAKDWVTWLAQQEAAGGHTRACHVNVADNGLIHRIESPRTVTRNCRQADVASSFTNDTTAAAALKVIRPDIVRACAGPDGNTVLGANAGGKTGRVVARYPDNDLSKNRNPCGSNKAYTCKNTNNFSAVIHKEGNDCFLLTAYPN